MSPHHKGFGLGASKHPHMGVFWEGFWSFESAIWKLALLLLKWVYINLIEEVIPIPFLLFFITTFTNCIVETLLMPPPPSFFFLLLSLPIRYLARECLVFHSLPQGVWWVKCLVIRFYTCSLTSGVLENAQNTLNE